jgi:membrane protein
MTEIISTVRSIVRLGHESELSFLAGSLAFFAFVSIVPALLLAISIGWILVGESMAMQVVALTDIYLSEEGSAVVGGALTGTSGRLGASIVGVVGLLWSAFKVFRAIDIAFDRIYRSETTTSLPRQLLNGAIAVTTLGSGVALLLTVQLLVDRVGLGLDPYTGLITSLVLIAGLVIFLAPLYYVMPPYRISVREIIPGTITAVCGLIVLRQVFHVYAMHASQYQAYGFLGAVLLFILWLYFGALVLLSGAVVNATVAEVVSGSDR